MKKIILLLLFLYITNEKESKKYSCGIKVEGKDREDCFSRKVTNKEEKNCCYFEAVINDAFSRRICYELPKEYVDKDSSEIIKNVSSNIKKDFLM